eukprot:jgi/Phyca11/20089/fgenesh1_pg.PHYCAscaffold_57_\
MVDLWKQVQAGINNSNTYIQPLHRPYDCPTCGAHIVPPSITLNGGRQLGTCACCKVGLPWTSFAKEGARSGARRCLKCACGPNSRAFWHRAAPPPQRPPSPPLTKLQRRAESAAHVAMAMEPPPQPALPPLEDREKKRRRRRRRRGLNPRYRAKRAKKDEE